MKVYAHKVITKIIPEIIIKTLKVETKIPSLKNFSLNVFLDSRKFMIIKFYASFAKVYAKCRLSHYYNS